jgi:hypothetical protein
MKLISLAVAAGLAASAAAAAPITYEGALVLDTPQTGAVSSSGLSNSPESDLSRYWSFEVMSGMTYYFWATRLERDLDPAMWLFAGTFADDTEFAGGLDAGIDVDDPGYIAFADDEIPAAGPFGNPLIGYAADFTGTVTAIVTNFASGPDDGGDGFFDYRVEVSKTPPPIPLPATLPLLLGGGAALAALARRRSRS